MSNIGDALTELQECVSKAICTKCSVLLLPGGAPLVSEVDYAWVRLVNSYPSLRFPAQDVEANQCAVAPLAYVIEVGIMHCLPLPNRSVVPTPEAMCDAAKTLADDMISLHSVFACCLEGWDMIVGSWTPLGPQARMVGGAWTLTITRTWAD